MKGFDIENFCFGWSIISRRGFFKRVGVGVGVVGVEGVDVEGVFDGGVG